MLQERPVSVEGIFEAARRAAGGDEEATEWLESLIAEGALTARSDVAHADLHALDARWRADWQRFLEVWNEARAAEDVWRRRPREVAGFDSAEIVSFDDVMFASPIRLDPPARRETNAALLLARADSAYVEAARDEARSTLAAVSGFCRWFEAVWSDAARDPVAALAMQGLVRYARQDAEQEKHRLGVSNRARARIIAETEEQLRRSLSDLLDAAQDEDVDDDEEIGNAMVSLGPFLHACDNALRLDYDEADCRDLRARAERLSPAGTLLQRALAEADRVREVNHAFMRPGRLLIAALVLAALTIPEATRWPGFVLALAAAGLIAYRLERSFSATRQVRVRWHALKKLGRDFLQS